MCVCSIVLIKRGGAMHKLLITGKSGKHLAVLLKRRCASDSHIRHSGRYRRPNQPAVWERDSANHSLPNGSVPFLLFGSVCLLKRHVGEVHHFSQHWRGKFEFAEVVITVLSKLFSLSVLKLLSWFLFHFQCLCFFTCIQ